MPRKAPPKFTHPTIQEVLKRSDAHLVLNPDGTHKTTGDHVLKNPKYYIKHKDGTTEERSVLADTITQTLSGASVPQVVNPPEPSDIGTTTDYSNNILFSNPSDIRDVEQWQFSDCYYLSPLASFIYSSPWFITQLIKKNADGTYGVTFRRNGIVTTVNVTAKIGSLQCKPNPSTGAIAIPIFEKAYAYFRTEANTLASLNWGSQYAVYTDFGCKAINLDPNASTITTSILSSLANGDSVTASTVNVIPTGINIIDSHVYTILTVFTDANGVVWVVVYNPWGIDGMTSTDGNNDGTVTLTLTDFRKAFSIVTPVTSYPSDVTKPSLVTVTQSLPNTPATTKEVTMNTLSANASTSISPDQYSAIANCQLETNGKKDIGFVSQTAQAYVEYTVNAVATGSFNIQLEVAAQNAASTVVSVNGTSVLTSTLTPTGSWSTYATVSLGSVQLNAGTNTIRFSAKIPTQYNIGNIILTPAGVTPSRTVKNVITLYTDNTYIIQ